MDEGRAGIATCAAKRKLQQANRAGAAALQFAERKSMVQGCRACARDIARPCITDRCARAYRIRPAGIVQYIGL